MAIDVFGVLKQIWPEWQIGNRIGGGSFGVVYEATREDYNVESHAAIKIVSIPTSESEIDTLRSEGLDMNASKTYLRGVVNDFVSEIRMMISLEGSSNIVDVKDYKVVERTDQIGWYIFIRMELLTPFDTYICDKKLTEDDVIQLGCDICTALEICAKEKIVHRDIKPGNILVHKNTGCYKLGDFGIARKLENMTGGLSQKGALNYMAPEVFNGGGYDSRVDIYSLGLVLYRLLNDNRMPFLDTEKQLLNPNERRNAIERRIRGENLPAPCKASPAMANLILRACAYDPNMRFPSATEMKNALLGIRRGTYKMSSNIDGNSCRQNPITLDQTARVHKPKRAELTPPERNNEFAKTKKNGKLFMIIVPVFCVLFALAVGSGLLAWRYSIDTIQASYIGGMVFVEDQLDCDVFEVYGVRKNGSKVKLREFSISPSELKRSGENEITITARGHECVTRITVYEIDRLIANYDEELLPVGSILDKNKITVIGVCTDGTEIVLMDYEADLSQKLIPGSNRIRIGYDNLETILTVEVEKPIISVSFNPNGGACNEPSRTVTYGDAIGTLPVIDNIAGYTFAGWTHNGDIIYDNTIIAETTDVVLSALWEPNTYTITFHNGEEAYTQEFVYDQAQMLIANQFTKPVSRFAGWAAAFNDGQIKYRNNESVSNLTSVNRENVDLYAVWELDRSLLLDDLVNDSGTTTVYKSPANGFTMFGSVYTGFTVRLGASYNIWGNGTQYCIFNISKWSEAGNVLKLTYGHIDGSENGSRRISVYFDSSDSAAYVFNYDSTNPPQTVNIAINSHESMKIVVDNLSGGQPVVGFSFESIA